MHSPPPPPLNNTRLTTITTGPKLVFLSHQAIKILPNAKALYRRAEAHLRDCSFQAAASDARRAIMLEPSCRELRTLLDRIRKEQARHQAKLNLDYKFEAVVDAKGEVSPKLSPSTTTRVNLKPN
jgi:hypothetical protein